MHQINPHYHLYLIRNTGGTEDFIRNLVDKYKAESYIHTLGPNDEIYKYYSAFDICLLPSISEGFCLAQVESASNGVQTFCSNSLPKLNTKLDNLYYLELKIDEWAKQIINVDFRNKRKNCLLNTQYDVNIWAEKYIKIYDSLNNVNI